MVPQFISDTYLGKLTRWLRIAGYDVLVPNDRSDRNLVNTAIREKRILLTRDRGIMHRRVAADGTLEAIFIDSDDVTEQVRQVFEKLGDRPKPAEFSRCATCNRELEYRRKEEVEGKVPPYVFQTQDSYTQCPGCERIYWHGTHWERMRERLEELRVGAQEG